MSLKKIKNLVIFSKDQMKGVFLLLLIIVGLQWGYYYLNFTKEEVPNSQKDQWLSFKSTLDSLQKNQIQSKDTIFPFNPNFITDFKGYKLGMNPTEINRLLEFRKQGKFANSPEEFQQVTGISDSLLAKISPYFKFPKWVKYKNSYHKGVTTDYSKYNYNKEDKKKVILDINTATKEDLMKIYGIGNAISDRILKQKEIYGAFVSMEQMNDIWGLSPEVIEKLNQHFKISTPPNFKKIKINEASIKELGQFPYFRFPVSKNIVTYRSMNGDIKIEDLTKIKDFPVDKIKIIALYLEF